MDYTVIEGFNTAFLNQLTKDQRIRFAVGDQITEETYKVSEIRTDNVLSWRVISPLTIRLSFHGVLRYK